MPNIIKESLNEYNHRPPGAILIVEHRPLGASLDEILSATLWW